MPAFNRDNLREERGVGIDIIDGCNLRCEQCYYKKSKAPFRKIGLRQIKEIVRKIKNYFSELYILGGEPTVHPQLPEILELAAREMETVVLVTNGLALADKDYCRKLAIPGVVISMHRKAISSGAEKIVDSLNQTKNSFRLSQKAWENVDKYWRGKIYVQINLLKPLLDGGHILDVFRWARENRYIPLVELVKSSLFFERGNQLDVSIKEAELLFKQLRKYDSLTESIPLIPPYYGNTCTLIETSIHITVDGSVIPCVGNQTPNYGNIFTDSIEDIMGHSLRHKIKDYSNWIVGSCKNCEYFDYCRGGCRGEARYATGCLRASDPYCWHHHLSATVKDMVPDSCDGCILEDFKGCSIKTL
jgi:radical SAM protein with 4Fe4S-binding SPASM domain